MSTLNNPDDQDATQALLLQSILQPDSKLSQVALRQTGLDVAMLETTYKEGVKPYLKYLHGYRPLLECDRSPMTTRSCTRMWSTIVPPRRSRSTSRPSYGAYSKRPSPFARAHSIA